jgi:hypothetical protein
MSGLWSPIWLCWVLPYGRELPPSWLPTEVPYWKRIICSQLLSAVVTLHEPAEGWSHMTATAADCRDLNLPVLASTIVIPSWLVRARSSACRPSGGRGPTVTLWCPTRESWRARGSFIDERDDASQVREMSMKALH